MLGAFGQAREDERGRTGVAPEAREMLAGLGLRAFIGLVVGHRAALYIGNRYIGNRFIRQSREESVYWVNFVPACCRERSN